MAYRKLFVDNAVCSRRFHLTYDDQAAEEKVEIRCPFCDLTIFESDRHPPVKLARQENLIQNMSLGDKIIRECHYRDVFTERARDEDQTRKGV